ncbi:hypothetical protein QJS04_geneDACA011827 [Acorus gramineus]|uniref:DUF4408 domain-containing protein n=1 Tax=Acorus gramineus TaxID=55184 RepID=A0AAV9BI42_ACOGR|nr:hypothetical protein QJS04_geneDACA011827 [Acorus gramineus]
MASIHRSSNSSWTFSAKAILASSAMLSTAVLLKLSVPSIVAFASSEAPRIWTSLLTWLTPPYLYVVINCIIISIAASSRFQKQNDDDDPAPKIAAAPMSTYQATPVKDPAIFGVPAPEEEDSEARSVVTMEATEAAEEEVDFVISRSEWIPRRRESEEVAQVPTPSPPAEKPLTSSRFGRRKTVKANPEGRTLGVAKARRNETLESTWRTITDGRAMPLTRHLRKADTWDVNNRPSPPAEKAMKKSETFDERKAAASPSPGSVSGGGRLRREPSMSQEELNRRVEAFINKFNQEMRLQRQESLQQYMEMVDRGRH